MKIAAALFCVLWAIIGANHSFEWWEVPELNTKNIAWMFSIVFGFIALTK